MARQPAVRPGCRFRFDIRSSVILVSLNGINDPANTYDRFAALVEKSVTEADNFTNVLSNPSANPGSSTDAQGSKPDLLRQSSTPSTNTNVLWRLAMPKSQ